MDHKDKHSMESKESLYSPGVGTFISFFVLLAFTIIGMIAGSFGAKATNIGAIGGTVGGFVLGFIFLGLFGKKLVK
ncbi:MAG: hypothetical protein AB1489_23290 [Acidobacteriota bacterium]